MLSEQDGINEQGGFFFLILNEQGEKKSEEIKQACSSNRDFREDYKGLLVLGGPRVSKGQEISKGINVFNFLRNSKKIFS